METRSHSGYRAEENDEHHTQEEGQYRPHSTGGTFRFFFLYGFGLGVNQPLADTTLVLGVLLKRFADEVLHECCDEDRDERSRDGDDPQIPVNP